MPTALPPRLLAALASVALVLDLPHLFTRGDVVRAVLVGFLAAAAAALGALMPARRLDRHAWLLALLPLAVPLLGLTASSSLSAVAVLRLASPWVLIAALTGGLARVWRGGGDAATAGLVLAAAGAVAGGWTLLDALARGGVGVGPFGRPGIAGPVLAALAVAALYRPPTLGRGVRVLTIVLPLAGLAVTQSRVGVVAAVLGALLVAAVMVTGRRARWVRAAAVGVVSISILVFAAAAGGHAEVPGSEKTVQVRVGLWSATSRLAVEKPLTGHGLGSFPSEILRVRDPDEARLSGGRRPMVAHNDALHAAAEGGLVAGLLVALWGVLLVLGGAHAVRRETERNAGRQAAADLGLLLTLLVASLGENVLLDPAGVLLAGLGAAGILARRPQADGRPTRFGGVILGVLCLAALASSTVLARDMLADRQLRLYRDGFRRALLPLDALVHARTHLEKGVLRWRPDHALAWYRLGELRARGNDHDAARQAFGKSLDADPGRTEARLEIARMWELEGRGERPRELLLEAQASDPTRFDVPIRLGHLALGPEPIPGEAPGDDYLPVRALRHYNEARMLDPDRFEVEVAEARLARRQGDLAGAGALLQRALRRVAPSAAATLASPGIPRTAVPTPEAMAAARRQAATLNVLATHPESAEVLLESFRLAELEGRAPPIWIAGLLELALAIDPRLAGTIRREAEFQLAAAAQRIDDAKQRAERTPGVAADYTRAQRALDAASLRLTGLLRAAQLDPERELRLAEAAAESRAFRLAYARYRALLSWASLQPRPRGPEGADQLDRLADLYSSAGKIASRVDGARAPGLFTRGHAFAGAAALVRGEGEDARRLLEMAVKDVPNDADVRIGLARALVLVGDLDAAEKEVLEVLRLRPDWRDRVRHEPGLGPVLERRAIQDALVGG